MFMKRIHPSGGDNFSKQARIPVLNEDLKVGLAKVETGRVRASKKVHEEDLIVSGPLTNDELSIERVPLNTYVEVAPEVRYEGDTMIIPVLEEEVVVQTRLKLVEEVRITRRQVERNVEHPLTPRKEEIVIDRLPPKEGSDSKENN